jgi:hypothetical protein
MFFLLQMYSTLCMPTKIINQIIFYWWWFFHFGTRKKFSSRSQTCHWNAFHNKHKSNCLTLIPLCLKSITKLPPNGYWIKRATTTPPPEQHFGGSGGRGCFLFSPEDLLNKNVTHKLSSNHIENDVSIENSWNKKFARHIFFFENILFRMSRSYFRS